MTEEQRILVVQPGDVLILKKLGDLEYTQVPHFVNGMKRLGEITGVQVFAFTEDVDVSTIPHEELERVYLKSVNDYMAMKEREAAEKDQG